MAGGPVTAPVCQRLHRKKGLSLERTSHHGNRKHAATLKGARALSADTSWGCYCSGAGGHKSTMEDRRTVAGKLPELVGADTAYTYV